MSVNPRARRPVGRQIPTPPRRGPSSGSPPEPARLQERDASKDSTANAPDPVIEQAKRDIDAGLVDTDMRATPGLDADRRARLVPGPGGKLPRTGR